MTDYVDIKELHASKAKEFRDGLLTQDDYFRWLRAMEYTEQEATQEIIHQVNERTILGEFAAGVIVKVLQIIDHKPRTRMATIRTILGDGAVLELGTGGFVTAKFTNISAATPLDIQRFAEDRAKIDEAKLTYDEKALEDFKRDFGL